MPTEPHAQGPAAREPSDRDPATQDVLDGVRLMRHVRIPMRDGVHLSADLFLPEGDGPWPVVIEYLPYRKDDRSHPRQALQVAMAKRGIAGCRLDLRGTGSSEGILDDEYTETEQLDGVDAIAWLAGRAWCNGNVGMWGISYGGFNALQVAMHRPPALKAIVPVMFTDDRYDEECHFDGGSVRGLYTWSDYPLMMVALNALPPHPDASDAPWLQSWRERLERQRPWVLRWLEEQTDGAYWANGSLNRDYGAVGCATFLIGGWRDGYPTAPLRTYANLSCPKKVWVGPWTHMLPHEGFPGPRADYLEEAFRFFDHWLNGAENGVMDEPPVRVYVQEHGRPEAIPGDWPGRWRADDALPAADPQARWSLTPDGGVVAHASPGLEEGASGGAPATEIEVPYDPTVGTAGGVWCWALPVAQGEDDARSLTFDGAPLDAPLEIVGAGAIELDVVFDRPVAGLAVRVEDVAPDGTSVRVTRGYRNATRRDSMHDPAPLIPGESVRLVVPLDATAWRFRAGHRLRVAVASGEWPAIWPTPHRFRAQLRLGGVARATLSLPVVRDAGRTVKLPAPAPLPPVADTSGADPEVWRAERDRLSDASTVEVRKANVVRSLIRETRMDLAKRVVAHLAPNDPAGAWVEGSNAMELHDHGHHVRSEAHARMSGDARTFHVSIRLTVELDGQPFFERRWEESIPRKLM